jgi:hypothetical protein
MLTTYEEIDRNTDKTFAYALLLRATVGYFKMLKMAYRLSIVCVALDHLCAVLTPEKIESLTPERASQVAVRFQDLHKILVEVARSSEAEALLRRHSLLSALILKLQDRTEDLCDIIETLILSNDQRFKDLLSDCVSSIGLP